MATSMNVSLVWTLRSSSLFMRRFRESHEKVRSTTGGWSSLARMLRGQIGSGVGTAGVRCDARCPPLAGGRRPHDANAPQTHAAPTTAAVDQFCAHFNELFGR